MDFVKFSVNDNIGIITVDRPPVNALNNQAKDEISAVFEEINSRDDVWCVIFSTGGKGFISGSDVKDFDGLTHEIATDIQQHDARMLGAIINCKVPVISAVKGYCLAMGIAIAAVSDFVIASDDSYFGIPEVKVGMTGASSVSCLLVPEKVSRYMSYTGNPLRVQEIAKYGNIHSIVRRDRLMSECMTLAKEITANYTISVQYIKEGLSKTNDFHVEDKFKIERIYQHKLIDDPNRGEMVSAFIEKRKPNFITGAQHKGE